MIFAKILGLYLLGFVFTSDGLRRHFTFRGQICKDDCSKRGYKYYWCNTDHDSSWDFCSGRSQADSYDKDCREECQHVGGQGYKCDPVDSNYFTDQMFCGLVEDGICPQLKASVPSLTIESHGDHKDGYWGPTDFCPKNEFVVGIQLLSQSYQGSQESPNNVVASIFTLGFYSLGQTLRKSCDDNGLTGIRLFCAKTWETAATSTIRGTCKLTSMLAMFKGGEWTEPKFCSGGFEKGFEVKYEKSQGTADDSGATNFNLHCSDSEILRFDLSHEPGDWPKEGPAMCPDNQFICGIRTKVETFSTGDDTGLNHVVIHCCRNEAKTLAALAKDCEPELTWKLVKTSDNCNGKTPTEYTISEMTGLSETTTNRHLNTESTGTTMDTIYGGEHGWETGTGWSALVKATLKLKFEQKLGTSHIVGHQYEKSFVSGFQRQVVHIDKVQVSPGYVSSMHKLVGQ